MVLTRGFTSSKQRNPQVLIVHSESAGGAVRCGAGEGNLANDWSPVLST